MGKYINPPNMSKEEYLEAYGKYHGLRPPAWSIIPEDQLAVCLVSNGSFTAAAICDTEDELKAFNKPTDPRPKLWFLVPKTALADFL